MIPLIIIPESCLLSEKESTPILLNLIPTTAAGPERDDLQYSDQGKRPQQTRIQVLQMAEMLSTLVERVLIQLFRMVFPHFHKGFGTH